MKRLIDHSLLQWKNNSRRKPLLLRGARQVGKTYAARTLGNTFNEYIELNFEQTERAVSLFEGDLDPERIIRDIALLVKKPIKPGTTLLFFDEIQKAPRALTALRYFYELMPELHIIAAGSLLDFAIEQVGIPVGRVESRYMYPLSFMEFLAALNESLIIEEILTHGLERPMTPVIHEKLLVLLAEYLALGGMPEIVRCWQAVKQPLECVHYQAHIIDTYRQDFTTYAKEHQIKYVELLFREVPRQLCHKFKYSSVEGDYRKRELSPALDLLETAGIIHKIFHSSCQGFPFGAQVNPQNYKVIFLDIGLSQAVLKLDLTQWFLNPLQEFINKGQLVEAFVGQELLAYSPSYIQGQLYYWQRETRTSQAEIDYILQEGECIVPIEIKPGTESTLRSLNFFLETHPQSPYGIRFSTRNYSLAGKIHSYPLYAIAKVCAQKQSDAYKMLTSLI